MLEPIIWIIAIELTGIVGIPISFKLFPNLPDKGYTINKALTLILIGYLFWALSTTGLVNPSTYIAILCVGLLTIASTVLLINNFKAIKNYLRSEYRIIILTEIIFLTLICAWIAIISGSASINHTEKPMDFAILNALVSATQFPPEDPWFSGHSISYYYFGYLIMAIFTKLTAVPSEISYNLAVATIPALAGISIFGLSTNLSRLSGARLRTAITIGVLSILTLTMISNLAGPVEFLSHRGWLNQSIIEWLNIKGLDGQISTNGGYFPESAWWWWRSTRLIDTVIHGISMDYTITEFPFFSFILGDLHPHMMAIPFFLLSLSVCLNLYCDKTPLNFSWIKNNPLQIIVISIIIGAQGFLNSWDLPVIWFLLALVILVHNLHISSCSRPSIYIVIDSIIFYSPIILGSVLLYTPFYLDLNSQIMGVQPVIEYRSRPILFFLAAGAPLLLVLSFVSVYIYQNLRRTDQSWASHAVICISFSALPLIAHYVVTTVLYDTALALQLISSPPILTLFLLSLSGITLFICLRPHGNTYIKFNFLIVTTALYLLAGAELFYIADLFESRMNTVFKLHYQSWILLSVAGSYGILYVSNTLLGKYKVKNIILYSWLTSIGLLLTFSCYHPIGTIIERSEVNYTESFRTIDGTKFLQKEHLPEYNTIEWLKIHSTQARIVEAAGSDYSDSNRISSFTGMPTILGWTGHEQQWGRSYLDIRKRSEDINLIYTSDDPDDIKAILSSYGIKYIISGPRERDLYGENNLSSFPYFLDTVFSDHGFIIYEFNSRTPDSND